MQFVNVEPGDILLFYARPSFAQRLVNAGEYLEDGVGKYYHCAVAVNSTQKIEALSRVYLTQVVQDQSFDVFRPPCPNVNRGLFEIRSYLGQRYDWFLIFDDALRYLTHGFIHLPDFLIRNQERQKKICSTLVADYLKYACWTGKLKRWPSPQDIAIALKDYQVSS